MRVDCAQLDPSAVIRPVPGEWHPRIPERLDEAELVEWRAGSERESRPAERRPRVADTAHRATETGGPSFGRLTSELISVCA